jgi:hypothetical protein
MSMLTQANRYDYPRVVTKTKQAKRIPDIRKCQHCKQEFQPNDWIEVRTLQYSEFAKNSVSTGWCHECARL